MIVRVNFKGTIKDGDKQSHVTDSIDIHAISTDGAKDIFLKWLSLAVGIRGNSGTFHPVDHSNSIIKITKAVEYHG